MLCVRPGRRSARRYLPCYEDDPRASGNRGSSLQPLMDAAEIMTVVRSSTIGMAHTEKNRLDPSFDVERRPVRGGNAGEAHAPVASAVSRPISNPLLLPPFFAPQN